MKVKDLFNKLSLAKYGDPYGIEEYNGLVYSFVCDWNYIINNFPECKLAKLKDPDFGDWDGLTELFNEDLINGNIPLKFPVIKENILYHAGYDIEIGFGCYWPLEDVIDSLEPKDFVISWGYADEDYDVKDFEIKPSLTAKINAILSR